MTHFGRLSPYKSTNRCRNVAGIVRRDALQRVSRISWPCKKFGESCPAGRGNPWISRLPETLRRRAVARLYAHANKLNFSPKVNTFHRKLSTICASRGNVGVVVGFSLLQSADGSCGRLKPATTPTQREMTTRFVWALPPASTRR
jgi:hypothetical protein